jgi:uncharacterized membrane protein YphA (DoxX/SURF4 family)
MVGCFVIGYFAINDMCSSTSSNGTNECVWKPSAQIIASLVLGSVFYVSTILFIVFGYVQSVHFPLEDETEDAYYNSALSVHAFTYLFIVVPLTLCVVMMAIIYSAMPRSFDRPTLMFFLSVLYIIGGLSASWVFVKLSRSFKRKMCCKSFVKRYRERKAAEKEKKATLTEVRTDTVSSKTKETSNVIQEQVTFVVGVTVSTEKK